MAKETDELLGDDAFQPTAGGSPLIERTQELTWALVDEQINDDEMRLLDSMLLSDDGARDTYIACMQLHSDLVFHYGDSAKVKPTVSAGKSPVLGFLGGTASPFEADRPRADDSRV